MPDTYLIHKEIFTAVDAETGEREIVKQTEVEVCDFNKSLLIIRQTWHEWENGEGSDMIVLSIEDLETILAKAKGR